MEFAIASHTAAAAALFVFTCDHGAALPAETAEALAAYPPSSVDRVVTTCEALYAASDAIPAAGLVLCAQLADYAQQNGWHELGATDRGAAIIRACRRRLGELTEVEAPPADDPAPLAIYLPA